MPGSPRSRPLLVLLLACLGLALAAAAPALAAAPAAVTEPTTSIGPTAATLAATVDPNGAETTVSFQFGPTSAYGTTVPARTLPIGDDPVRVEARVTGLEPSTTYYVRAAAANADGTGSGAGRSFRTAAAPRPSIPRFTTAETTTTTTTAVATVDPNGFATRVVAEVRRPGQPFFATPAVDVGAGTAGVPVRLPIGGLEPATSYEVRVVATSRGGRRESALRRITTARQPGGISLAPDPRTVRIGRSVTLAGTVSGTGAGGAPVRVQGRPFPFTSAFADVGNRLLAASNGTFRTTVVPTTTTQYRASAVVQGRTVTSPVVTVRVAPSVSFTVRRRSGGRVRVSGVVRPAGDAVVSLERLTATGRRVTVARTATRPSGGYAFRTRRLTRTATYVVTANPADGQYATGDSRRRRLQAR